MRAGRAAVVALAVAVAVGLVAAPALAAPSDDPTWAEVQAARKDVRLQAGEVAKIQKSLDGVQAEAGRLGSIALQKAAAAGVAQQRLDAAQSVVADLEHRVRAAQDRATASRRTAGAVATQLYRSGDPTLSVWLAGRASGSLLYRLGALARIGDSSSSMLETARTEQRQAAALGDEARAGAAVRDDLADRAKAAANLARAAEARAAAQVAATRSQRSTLRAQLKSLKARSSSLEDSYAEAQAAKRAAAARGVGGGGAALAGIAPGPDSLSPAGAQSYAASRLGSYGWSSGQQSCLVQLWDIESGWRWNALNASSGAYGIPQSLPGSKLATAGGDWTTSSTTQITWGLGYIRARYGSPCAALSFETSHVPYWY